MQDNWKGPFLGAHVSAAGGLSQSIRNAERLGAETIQIFGASPRQWNAKLPIRADIKEYKEALKKSSVQSVYLHAAYLVNLATADRSLYEKSVENLSAHLKIAELIGAQGLIFHLGSDTGLDRNSSLRRVISGMKLVLKNVPGKSMLLMENSSGGGRKVGASPEEIGELLKGVPSRRIGVCLDTAHAYEAGEISYTPKSIKDFLRKWRTYIGLRNLVVIHANDSRTPFASGIDRHENIGRGHIGLKGFRNLAREKNLWNADWILEVPGFANDGPDRQNLSILRNCFK